MGPRWLPASLCRRGYRQWKTGFHSEPKKSGGPLFLCKFQVQDDGGTANGGKRSGPQWAGTEHPTGESESGARGNFGDDHAVQDTVYTFKTADFGFTDPNNNPPNSLLAVKMTLLPTVGS